MVLFSYILAITPNNQYTKTSTAKVIRALIFVPIRALIITGKLNSNLMGGKRNVEDDIIQLYVGIRMTIYWAIAITLLVALLIAVKLCYKSPKPLRQYLS